MKVENEWVFGRQPVVELYARVVELDALTDPVRAGAQDEHLRPVRRGDLGLLLVGAVVVRGVAPNSAAHVSTVLYTGRMPSRWRRLRTPSSPANSGRSAAICRSDRPARFAVRSSGSSSTRRRRISARRSTSAAIWSTNHGSMPEASATSLDAWRRRGGRARPCTAGRRAGPAARRAVRRPSGRAPSRTGRLGLHRPHRLAERLLEGAADRHRLADGLHRAS